MDSKEIKKNIKRKVLSKKINEFLPSFDENSFINIDETIAFSENVYKKIELMEQIILNKHLESNLKEIYKIKNTFSNVNTKNGVLLHYYDSISGAVLISVNDFFENIELILDFSEFSLGKRDLIFAHQFLKFGICIERYEHYNKLVIWNEF